MKSSFAAALSGLLFGTGLLVSGMTRPEKVIGFLDVFGRWDASLALVMAGAVAVYSVAYRLVRRRRSPVFDQKFHIPTQSKIDVRLLSGAVIFGVGWGLVGFCPGPGLVSAASGSVTAIVFVGGMSAGTLFENAAARRALANRLRPSGRQRAVFDGDPRSSRLSERSPRRTAP